MASKSIIATIIGLATPLLAVAQEYGYTYGQQSNLLYRVSIPSGDTHPVGGFVYELQSFAFSPNGELYGLGNSDPSLTRVDVSTGEMTTLGTVSVPPGQEPSGISFDGEDRLLLLANASPQSALYEINPATISASLITSVDSDTLTKIAVSGQTCYALDYQGRLFAVDLATGGVSSLPGSTASGILDISFDHNGQLWGIESPPHPVLMCESKFLVRFNLTTGEPIRVVQLPTTDGDCLWPLAIQPDQALAIPAHGPIGTLFMVIFLAFLGTVVLLLRKGTAT